MRRNVLRDAARWVVPYRWIARAAALGALLLALCAGAPDALAGERAGTAAEPARTTRAAAAARPAPLLLERAPCAQSGSSYEEYVERAKRQWASDEAAARAQGRQLRPVEEFVAALPDAAGYAKRKEYAGFGCERLVYRSDGLRVVAFLWRPLQGAPAGSAGLPLIVFNRGGVGEDFKLRPNTFFGFYNYVAAGYAVLGTQYRGNDGSEGRDEIGGADVHDVLNLFALAKELGGIDVSRAYMLGFSRGALMTLLALEQQAPVRAAALMGAATDWIGRPPNAGLRKMLAEHIPGFDADPDGALRARSPLLRPQAIGVPLLLLHGGGDGLADPSDSTRYATELLRLRKPVELVIYEGDSHGIALNAADRDRRILEWFARH
ncbi:MAG: prolyl oligopeptidase family serine peptidase [Steroidobacteraceae bacterium]